MSSQKWQRDYTIIGVLFLLAVLYDLTIYLWRPLSNVHKVEGIIGILLGLYISSKPSANLLDLLFDLLSNRFVTVKGVRLILWLIVNILLLGVGWYIITLGATRFTSI